MNPVRAFPRCWSSLTVLLLLISAAPALAQTAQVAKSNAPSMSAPLQKQSSGDCSCSGSTGSGPCSCSCKGGCCACVCSDGGGCTCDCIFAPTVALPAGMTVNSAVAALSASTALMPKIVILSGSDEVLPFSINTTPWQALARLSGLTGVRLGVVEPSPQTAANNSLSSVLGVPAQAIGDRPQAAVREVQPTPLTRTLSLCVHENAGLPVVLDKLSRITGYAFDVVGTPAQHFTLTAKGTLTDVLSQLSTAAGGVTITIAQ